MSNGGVDNIILTSFALSGITMGMKKPKIAVKRITARIRADLLVQAKRIAEKKRWSVNDFIEESMILGIAHYES